MTTHQKPAALVLVFSKHTYLEAFVAALSARVPYDDLLIFAAKPQPGTTEWSWILLRVRLLSLFGSIATCSVNICLCVDDNIA